MLVLNHYHPDEYLGSRLFGAFPDEFLDIPGFGAGGARIRLMEFLDHFYSEITKIICKNDRGTKKRLDATCAALAAFFAKKFQIMEPVCVGIATYLLIMLLEATKGAFCKMTKEQVKQILDPSGDA